MTENPGLEEQALNKVLEVGFATQVDQAEAINVNAHTDLLKLLRGEVDSVALAGRGLVLQHDLRIQAIELEADSIEVNPLGVLLGRIELDRAKITTAKVTLTEADLNRALSSESILSRMQNLPLQVDGRSVRIDIQQLQVQLLDHNRWGMELSLLLHDGSPQQFKLVGWSKMQAARPRLILEDFRCTEGGGLPLDVMTAAMQKLNEWACLPFFPYEDMAIKLQEIRVHNGYMILQTEIDIDHRPWA